MEDLRQKLEANQNALEMEERLRRQAREDLENEKLKTVKLDKTIQQRDTSIKSGKIQFHVFNINNLECVCVT